MQQSAPTRFTAHVTAIGASRHSIVNGQVVFTTPVTLHVVGYDPHRIRASVRGEAALVTLSAAHDSRAEVEVELAPADHIADGRRLITAAVDAHAAAMQRQHAALRKHLAALR